MKDLLGDDLIHGDLVQEPFGLIEFAENAEPRCACLLLLDVSGSMQGPKMDALNAGLEQFARELPQDRLAAKRVDLAVVTFGNTVTVVNDFQSAQEFSPASLTADGGTPLGEAVCTGLDLLAKRQALYRGNGIVPYRPVVFAITDGVPTDDWHRAAERVRQGEERKSFSFFAVGVDGADMAMLAKLSVRTPLMLKGTAFSEMFQWLSSSLAAVSRSSVGAPVAAVNPTGPAGWATII